LIRIINNVTNNHHVFGYLVNENDSDYGITDIMFNTDSTVIILDKYNRCLNKLNINDNSVSKIIDFPLLSKFDLERIVYFQNKYLVVTNSNVFYLLDEKFSLLKEIPVKKGEKEIFKLSSDSLLIHLKYEDAPQAKDYSVDGLFISINNSLLCEEKRIKYIPKNQYVISGSGMNIKYLDGGLKTDIGFINTIKEFNLKTKVICNNVDIKSNKIIWFFQNKNFVSIYFANLCN